MKSIRRLPEGELAIMQMIWHSEPPVSRAEIEQMLGKEHQLASTTILTFLTRLCEKDFLSVEKRGKTNYYTPRIEEREYLASESRNILDKLYGGSLAAFATALCDSGIGREDLEELKEMLERGTL